MSGLGVGMSGTLVPMGTGEPASSHQNFSTDGYHGQAKLSIMANPGTNGIHFNLTK